MDKQRVIEKIRKLLSLGDLDKSKTSDGEARSAASKAHFLMDRYNVTLEEIETPNKMSMVNPLSACTDEATYIAVLLNEHFGVKVFEQVDKKTKKKHLMIFGEDHKVSRAKHLLEFLSRTYYEYWREYLDLWKYSQRELESSPAIEPDRIPQALRQIGFCGSLPKNFRFYRKSFFRGLTVGLLIRLRDNPLLPEGDAQEAGMPEFDDDSGVEETSDVKMTKFENDEIPEIVAAGYMESQKIDLFECLPERKETRRIA